ncbi:MAG: hypothetical protein U1E89_03815 [Burkholderiaceae bacterium]
MSLSLVLTIIGAIAVGALLALVPTVIYFRRQLLRLTERAQLNERGKVKAHELLLEARAQVEALQKELIEAKRNGVVQAASASARAAAAAAEAEAARERAKAELVRQLEANDRINESHAASEFADTQPLGTGFGALARH